jgi:hypothetical protein
LETANRIASVAFDNEYIYAAVRDLQTDKKWLYLYFRVSGSFYKRFELDHLPVDMIAVAEDHKLFLFAFDKLTTHIIYFNLNNENFVLENSIPNFQLAGQVIRQNDNYFLYDPHTIQLWSSSSNAISLIAKGNNINGLATFDSGDFIFYLDDNIFEVVHPNPDYAGYNLHMPLTLITSISK